MVFASQYLRGKVDPEEPYYLLDTGAKLKLKMQTEDVSPGDYTATKSAAATLRRQGTVYLTDGKAIEVDTTPGNKLAAYFQMFTWPFTPTYPYRCKAVMRIADATNMIYSPGLIGTLNASNQTVAACGCAYQGGPRLHVDHEEGFWLSGVTMPLNEWFKIELILTSNTEYYLEYNGTKYGPFTVRYGGPSKSLGLHGDHNAAADRGQLHMYYDEIKVYKRETAYDPTSAIAPDKVHFLHADFEYADEMSMFTLTLAGNGTLTRSTAEAYAGSYSLECNTLGTGAKRAEFRRSTVEWSTPYYAPTYPVWHQCRFKVKQVDYYSYLYVLGIERGGSWMATCGLEDADLNLDVWAGSWTYDVFPLSLDTWYKIAIKELSDTQVEFYVDDGLVAGPLTKAVTGYSTGFFRMGDTGPGAGLGAWLAYWDNLEWFRPI